MTRTAPASRRTLRIAGSICSAALLSTVSWSALAAEPNFPITSQQRSTAQQVAQSGVALSELAPNAPDSYTVKAGDT